MANLFVELEQDVADWLDAHLKYYFGGTPNANADVVVKAIEDEKAKVQSESSKNKPGMKPDDPPVDPPVDPNVPES
jgi:hypothetical protein